HVRRRVHPRRGAVLLRGDAPSLRPRGRGAAFTRRGGSRRRPQGLEVQPGRDLGRRPPDRRDRLAPRRRRRAPRARHGRLRCALHLLPASKGRREEHMSTGAAARAPEAELQPYSLRELVWYFLHLGTTGFGGPIALVGYMQRDLVERRRWIALKDYKEGLALAQLAPGPLAAQLAIYLGWLDHGVFGATLVAVAFVLPSFAMVLALSAFYLAYGGISWMQGAFYGIGAAVIAIIARSTYKLAKSTLAKDPLLWALFLVSAVVTAWTERELVWLFVLCGVVGLLAKMRLPRAASLALVPWPFLLTGLDGPASTSTLWRIATCFAEAGAFVFGSGRALVPLFHSPV